MTRNVPQNYTLYFQGAPFDCFKINPPLPFVEFQIEIKNEIGSKTEILNKRDIESYKIWRIQRVQLNILWRGTIFQI